MIFVRLCVDNFANRIADSEIGDLVDRDPRPVAKFLVGVFMERDAREGQKRNEPTNHEYSVSEKVEISNIFECLYLALVEVVFIQGLFYERKLEMSTNAFGYVRITEIPDGEAPFWVRREWLGLLLPCDPVCGFPSGGMEKGAVSGKVAEKNRFGFSVPQAAALQVLATKSQDAFNYWKRLGFPKPPPYDYFGFSETEAVVVAGVAYQEIVVVTEEMMGDPNR